MSRRLPPATRPPLLHKHLLNLRLRLDRHRQCDNPAQQRAAEQKFTTHLSPTAGPLRLLDTDFPDRTLLGIAEWNLNVALSFLDR